MLSCPYCHFPLEKEKPFLGPYCNAGCFYAFSLSHKNRIFLVRFCTVFFLFGMVILLSYGGGLLANETVRLPLLLALVTTMLVLAGPSFFRSSVPQHGRLNPGINQLWLLFPYALDYGFSLYLLIDPQWQIVVSYKPFLLSATMLVIYFLLSLLEAFCHKKAYEDVLWFSSLKPAKARLIVKNQEMMAKSTSLKKGDTVRVLAGEIIPADGVIISGTTTVDESVFTSEKTILIKKMGDTAKAASLNRDQTILLQLQENPENHFVNGVSHLLHRALFDIPKWHSALQKIPFFLLIIFVADAVWRFWLEGPIPLPLILPHLVTFSVIMGFFAFVHVAPITLLLGIGRLAQAGIFVQSAGIFSALAKIHTLFFDKTGTLTRGQYHFSQLFLEPGTNQGTFLSALFSLEAQSNHPLARAVETHPWYIEIEKHGVKNFETHPGLGISGVITERGNSEHFVAVGNLRFLKRCQMYVSRAMREAIEDLESVGETAILCGWDGRGRGLIGFSDTLRADVKPMLLALKKLCLKPVMITGDHDEMIGYLSYMHGLDQVYTRCLPQEKAKKIKNRQEKGEKVAMIAGTLDEKEAFEAADMGIMLGSGTVLCEDPVDVLILGQSLMHIPEVISEARHVHGVLKYGTFLSILYCGGATALSLLHLLHPTGALMAMAFCGMLLNVFPLKLQKKKGHPKNPPSLEGSGPGGEWLALECPL